MLFSSVLGVIYMLRGKEFDSGVGRCILLSCWCCATLGIRVGRTQFLDGVSLTLNVLHTVVPASRHKTDGGDKGPMIFHHMNSACLKSDGPCEV